jgi:hypothetical protein
MNEVHHTSQRGSTLVMIIGVMAALAVMASILVAVIGNMQANTADSRVRNKAQGVAEATMDAQMYALAKDWPETATPSPVPTMNAAVVRTQFSTSEFPNGTNGGFAAAVYYDNSDTSGDGKVTSADAKYDANNDGRMIIEAQGNVGDRAARIQGMVQRTFVNTLFPQGLVVYDGGDMNSNAVGAQIRVYNQGTAPAVTGQVGGALQDASVFGAGISIQTTGVTPWDQIVSVATVQQVTAMAKGTGRYYDLTAGDSLPTDFSGVCVIKTNPGQEVDLPQNAGINMSAAVGAVPAASDEPGILFIFGNPIVRAQGHTNFYGIFYSDGQLGEASGQSYSGTPTFYGQVICRAFMDVRGTCNILYDDSAIMKLRNNYTLTVVLVSNTWREIRTK